MKNWLLSLIFLPALAGTAFAHDPPPEYPWAPDVVIMDWYGYSVWPMGTTFEKRVVSGYHAHWFQNQVPTIVPKIDYRIDTQQIKTFVNEPKVVEEKQKYLTYQPVPRLVEREITTYVLLPLVLANLSGHPMVTCTVEVRTHKVQYTVFDYRPVEKVATVKVTKMVPTPKTIEYRQAVPVVTYNQTMKTEWQYLNVPYQRVVDVPVIYHIPQMFWP